MKKSLIFFVMLPWITLTLGQGQSIVLQFTAVANASYTQLDSVKVMNRTQGGYNVIRWPDTTLTFNHTPGDLLLYIGYSKGYPAGVDEGDRKGNEFELFQIHPNPVKGQGEVSLYTPVRGILSLMITDMHGRLYTYNFNLLESGYHNFRFLPGCEGIYLLTAVWQGITQSIKIMTLGSTSEKRARLEYLGSANNHNAMNFPIVNQGLVMQESGILDIPNTSKTYTFQFATNMPCPDSPVVTYEGQNYNTIQIYSQCWLKENLNVGTMRPGNQSQANDSIKEKYCYGNNLDSCNKYGGLYQWSEMMQYSTIEGTQGICPPGWHLPTQEEWKVLEGAVDSQFGIGDTIWNNIGLQGFDTGENLKTDNGWYEEGNGNDLFGFSGLPGGNRNFIGQFTFVGHLTGYWTSTESDSDNAWCRTLIFDHPEVFRYDHAKSYGFSVRCIKNN